MRDRHQDSFEFARPQKPAHESANRIDYDEPLDLDMAPSNPPFELTGVFDDEQYAVYLGWCHLGLDIALDQAIASDKAIFV